MVGKESWIACTTSEQNPLYFETNVVSTKLVLSGYAKVKLHNTNFINGEEHFKIEILLLSEKK